MGDRFIVNVEAAILRGERYLLIRRGAAEGHAAGLLSLPGGKVDLVAPGEGILEEALGREIREELDLELLPEMRYVHSSHFVADTGEPVIDIVFLCRDLGGEPRAVDPGEVAEILWRSAAEITADPTVPPWTRRSVELAEERRRQLA